MKIRYSLGLFFLIFSAVLISKTQAQGMMDPVSFEITQAPAHVGVTDTFSIKMQAQIEGDWHLYSINNDPSAGPYPTKITPVDSSGLVITGEIEESDPIVEMDPNFNAKLGWHTGQATFTVPLMFRSIPAGKSQIALTVRYQVCNDKVCLPPKAKTVTHSITVEAAVKQQGGTILSSPNKKKSGTSVARGKSVFSFLWIALTAGFAALLTPCVFPMLPLTVSFFSKKSRKNHAGVGQAFIFGLAIVATFTVLGVLLAAFIGAAGANQFAANPWINLLIGIVLVVFAFSLLGSFEIRLPYQLTNWLNRKSNESAGIIGVFFMALTISAVSFSCTAPFVGGILAATAGGAWFYPILGMIGFSAAFASPFIIFAMFPSWLESLPKSGSWMNIIKVLLGFIELAAAIKFISNADLIWNWQLVSRPFAIAAWIAISLLAGLYVLGIFTIQDDQKSNNIGTGRVMLSLPFLLFGFYLIPGLLGASLGIWDAWLPPKKATDVSVVSSVTTTAISNADSKTARDDAWSGDYEQSLKIAQQKNMPVFIDFTGYTCTNCRAMEANVFPKADIQSYFSKMHLVRLYTDDASDGPKYQKLQLQLTGTIALPTYVILDPGQKKVVRQISGYTDTKSFKEFLQKGMQQYKQL